MALVSIDGIDGDTNTSPSITNRVDLKDNLDFYFRNFNMSLNNESQAVVARHDPSKSHNPEIAR